jgi:ABC-type branched-subunit amino acid transport system substrate-binding protein
MMEALTNFGCQISGGHVIYVSAPDRRMASIYRRGRVVKRLSVMGVFSLGLVSALLMSACGSSNSGSSSTSSTSAASATNAPAAPTGSPLQIGVVYTNNVVAGVGQTILSGAEGAAKYLNASGGIGGHPVAIDACDDHLNPAGDAQCAHQFINNHDLFVTGLTGFWGQEGLPITSAANILSSTTCATQQEASDPNSVVIAGTTCATFPALAEYLVQQKHIKSVAVITINIPLAISAAQQGVGAPLKKLGIDVKVIPIDPALTDLTAPLVTGKNYQVVFLLMPTAQITQALSTASKLGLTNQYAATGIAIDPVALRSLGSASKGLWTASDFLNPDDPHPGPDVSAFLAAMKKYENTASPNLVEQWAFSEVVTISHMAAKVGTGVDASNLLSYAKNLPAGFPIFMGYQTTNTPPAGFPALHGVGARVMQWNGTHLVDVGGKWFTPGPDGP